MNYDNFNKDEDDNNRDKEEILLHNVNIGRCIALHKKPINNFNVPLLKPTPPVVRINPKRRKELPSSNKERKITTYRDTLYKQKYDIDGKSYIRSSHTPYYNAHYHPSSEVCQM